jgi:hypothetical protein
MRQTFENTSTAWVAYRYYLSNVYNSNIFISEDTTALYRPLFAIVRVRDKRFFDGLDCNIATEYTATMQGLALIQTDFKNAIRLTIVQQSAHPTPFPPSPFARPVQSVLAVL